MSKNILNNIVTDESFKDSNLNIYSNGKYKLESSCKLDQVINIDKYLNVELFELKNEDIINRKCNYYIDDNASLVINKFYSSKEVNEEINIYLNGYNSKVILNIGIISEGSHFYRINIYSNNKCTFSESNIHGVSLNDNSIIIENNGYIPKGKSGSILNQDNKIITLGKNNSKIRPNLFIDEYDVEASHGAYIGKFSEEELFYLKSRGLNEKEANNLLIKGFLINKMVLEESEEKEINNIIDKYWR